MEEQREILKQFRQQQEKYVYYIVALCVTSIGFSIIKTSGQTIKWSQIPLAIAVISWSTSVYCGLTFLRYVISSLYANKVYLDITQGLHPDFQTNPAIREAAADGVMSAIQKNSNKTMQYSKWQNWLFYFGIILFIIWHVIEMYLTAA